MIAGGYATPVWDETTVLPMLPRDGSLQRRAVQSKGSQGVMMKVPTRATKEERERHMRHRRLTPHSHRER